MERLTVTVEADQAAVLRAVAASHGTTVSAVVRAATEALEIEAEDGPIQRQIKPDARGGARPGAGRPRRHAEEAA